MQATPLPFKEAIFAHSAAENEARHKEFERKAGASAFAFLFDKNSLRRESEQDREEKSRGKGPEGKGPLLRGI